MFSLPILVLIFKLDMDCLIECNYPLLVLVMQWVMIVYPFLWLLLYLHMFRQRRSKLAKRETSGNRRKVAKPKLVD